MVSHPQSARVLAGGVKHTKATRAVLGISRSTVLSNQSSVPMFHHLLKRGGDEYRGLKKTVFQGCIGSFKYESGSRFVRQISGNFAEHIDSFISISVMKTTPQLAMTVSTRSSDLRTRCLGREKLVMYVRI